MLRNTRHERFAQGVTQGKPGSKAYADAGYKARGNSAEVNAARLLRNAKVAARITDLKTQAAERAIVTTEDVLRGLRDEAELYGDGASHSARVTAWAHLGKHLSMFTDKQELTIKRDPREMSTDELEEYLRVRGLLE